MSDSTRLVVAALATWRVTALVVSEDGPGQILVRARAAVDGTPLAGVMDCFGCASIWTGAAASTLALAGRAPARDIVVTALAMSGSAYLLEELLRAAVPERGAGWVEEPDADPAWISVTGPARPTGPPP